MVLSSKDRVVVRRFLREALKGAAIEEAEHIKRLAQWANIKLEQDSLTEQEREDMRATGQRRRRRGFGG